MIPPFPFLLRFFFLLFVSVFQKAKASWSVFLDFGPESVRPCERVFRFIIGSFSFSPHA